MDDVTASPAPPSPMSSAAQQPCPPKKSTTLSVDRAAFLLLRVKKAFKKKRQHRKEKQSQLASAALAASQTRSCRKIPPPLLRSRTLPAIIIPGIPVVSVHTDRSAFQLEERAAGGKASSHRWSVWARNTPATTPGGSCSYASSSGSSNTNNFNYTNTNTNTNTSSSSNNNNNSSTLKSLNLPKDDTTLVYRRKSSGSTPHSVAANNAKLALQQQQQQYQQAYITDASLLQMSDDFECHADGSVLLRIPAPHVVAARAYRLAAKKRSTGSSSSAETRTPDAAQQLLYDSSSNQLTASTHSGGSGSSHSSNCSAGGGGSSTNTAFTRLAKLLHQTSITASRQTHAGDHIFPAAAAAPGCLTSGEATGLDDAPRRLSWERRKDSSALQRSASIDSFAEIVWSDTPRPSLDVPRAPFSKRPSASSLFSNCSSSSSQCAQLNINYGIGSGSGGGLTGDLSSGSGNAGSNRRESLLSPSSTRRNKLTRIINDNILPHTLTNDDNAVVWRTDRTSYENLSESSVILRKTSSTCSSINNNNNNNQNSNNNNNSSNNNNKNHLQHHALVENRAKRDNSNSNCNSHLNSAFRWSEQLTQNVSIAKIRTAISCTAHDLKEMEFLLPHARTSASASSSTSAASTATTPTSTAAPPAAALGQPHTRHDDMSSGLSISRHSQKANNHTNMSQPKNAKLNAAQRNASGPDENHAGNVVQPQPQQQQQQLQHLAIHRHPASARANKAGNTPHRSKMSKKQLKLAQAQLDKLTQINLHLHALFSAVEHGHLDKARTILESTDVDVNSINSDGLSALDVAVLSNNRSMTKMLLQHGAVEASQFSTETIGSKLNGLLKDAESRIYDLSGAEGSCQPTFTARPSISSIIIGNTGSSVTSCTGNEIDKQIGIWERRVKGLRRMLLGWDQARPPDAPASVTVDVTGENSIVVQILEPFEGAIGTKFKVQWSTRADFNNIMGERELMDWTSFHGTMGAQCYVSGLTQGRRYFIRATCGNVKGWGPHKTSVPASIVPSSWRDLNNREDRYSGQQRVLDNLFTAVRLARPADVSELTLDPAATHRRNPKKKTTIKQLFSVASKFQKNLRRGIYLASIIYCEDKVLVTSEDFLPAIEIDETYPSTLHSDYHWLMKVACTWDDVKSLRTDMERNLTSAVHFRTKLLSAICQMQSALGLTDLGTLYYKPLRDSHGTVVLTSIQAVRSQKTVSILNSRWLPVNKLQKKIVALLEDYNINEMLISSLGEQVHYHQVAGQRLEAGLYLGYLKMQCSVEQIQLVVPVKTPNVLPHYKVRDNSHITAEEWQILKRGEQADSAEGGGSSALGLEFNANSEATTEVQRLFLYDLTAATHKLFAYMNIKPQDACTHRLYDVEVIEHSKDISFLVICPSVELTCAVPGQSELLLQRDDLASLSIQAFEMIHLRTYQPGIIQKYARLSCILELDTALANHSHREAFSTSELQTAKERLAKLHELSSNLNVVWKSVRWLMDVIAFARDKNTQASAAMKEILDFAQANDEMVRSSSKKQLLQLPIRDVKFAKSGSGRGSWPGPVANSQSGSNTCIAVEHSKSEQNLGRSARTPTSGISPTPPVQTLTTSQASTNQQLLQVTNEFASSDILLRKNSGDSMSSQYTTRSFYSATGSTGGSNNELGLMCGIPPSRSDDTLAQAAAEVLKQKQSTSLHRKRTSSNIAASSSTSAPLITVYSSSSAPYLAGDSAMSSSSLCSKSETKLQKTMSPQIAPVAAAATTAADVDAMCVSKVKAVSSANSREGGLYPKSTPSAAVQTETKTATTDELLATAAAAAGAASKSSSTKSLSRQSSEEDSGSCSSGLTSAQIANTQSQPSGIIQVYTAYNTGLASGTSLKLHVTPKTTAREVINLVVKQLNMAAVLKGSNGPIYAADTLDNFCLVAVIGARERCLRDDFKPLQLQNPWKKGRLYVRQKHELLAAIEHANRKSHLI